ncbi:MAG: hypothetical protein MUF71_21540 [Candidatus Kapabacteria bacterium]|jgi:hypothetical protein|nr:hypothetical protein [Candidatus Kapabacteria bacterium]
MIKILKITFIVDGIIATAFGVFSWLYPLKTFGSIIAIPDEHSSIFLSILSSLSLFYLVIGITCLIGSKSQPSISFWIASLMLTRHFFEGAIKIADLGKTWLIGNPYQDIVIHSVFLLAYLIGLIYADKNATEIKGLTE